MPIAETIWHFLRAYGYPVFFLLLLLEECGVPLLFVPGDMLVMWAGYRYSIGRENVWVIVALSTLAVALGSSTLFAVSRRFGPKLLCFAQRFMHFSPAKVEQAERWRGRWGVWAVIAGRLIPGLRTPTSIAAGTLGLPYRSFLPGAVAAALIWTLFYFWVGAALGAAYDRIGFRQMLEQYVLHRQGALLLGVAAVTLALLLFARHRRSRPRQAGV